MSDKIQRLINELKKECLKDNKRCVVILKKIGDDDIHQKIIQYVVNRITQIYNVSVEEIISWRKSSDAKQAKKMIVFILINRYAIKVSHLANYLGVSCQSISYMASNPNSVYAINNYKLFVSKIEDELSNALDLQS
jgi:mannose/fructose/N-acetylgalactosamine-specific phosphotransferase system component IIB